MSKTPLFSRLRRSYQIARGRRPEERDQALRRKLLSLAAASVAASAASCAEEETITERVAVVGGGIAGLHCAYRLKEAGIDVTVYEAQKRTGGRMFTGKGLFTAAPDQICELGGELIDSNHATLLALAEEFDLELHDRFANEPPAFKREQYLVGGVEVPDARIVEQFSEVAPLMDMLVASADEDEASFAMLDAISLQVWLDDNVPIAMYPELHHIIATAYRGEYGLENSEQSCLNLLYLIGADDPDPFRIFGESDERFHAALGSDAFPTALADAIGPKSIALDHKLIAAREVDGGFELDFESDGKTSTVTATRVVFAMPFSVLRDVDLSGLTLSEEKRDIIANLGYGTNAKVMGGFSEQVWRTTHNASGNLTTDLPVQQTWDTTIGQPGAHGILTNFLGGQQGVASKDGSEDAWMKKVLPDLEMIWPGISAAYSGVAVRMHWPTVPTMKGSYTCYKPGQWAYFGLQGLREGNIHFCGEHTSDDFQGWMEGGAESGGLVAAEIMDDAGKSQPQSLRRALGYKLLIPQSTYKADRFPRMNVFQRRREVRRIARALLDEARER
jgi:monoamine oxidase